jgi:maltose O-acetyltransferase
MMRRIAYVLYYAFARHLPESTKPYAFGARWLRGALAGRMLGQAGRSINVERGADFGSGRQVKLGDRSGLGVNCRIVGVVSIGSDVMIGPDVYIVSLNHRTLPSVPMIEQGMCEHEPVIIESDVWIGTRAIILPGVRVGRGAVVGAGAVVPKDVPPNAVVVGNPARVVRFRSPAEVAEKLR